MLCRKAGRDEGMVLSDRTKGCCSSDLNEPLHPNHDQFAELDAHNSADGPKTPSLRIPARVLMNRLLLRDKKDQKSFHPACRATIQAATFSGVLLANHRARITGSSWWS